jgi:hypothetical protein
VKNEYPASASFAKLQAMIRMIPTKPANVTCQSDNNTRIIFFLKKCRKVFVVLQNAGELVLSLQQVF